MSIDAWIGVTSAEIGIIVAAAAGVKWLVKKYLSELRPNGGGSIHDKINKEIIPLLNKLDKRQDSIWKNMTEVKTKIAKLEGRFEQHVEEGD